MEHLFIPYHLAVLAKEANFEEPCLAVYDCSFLKPEFTDKDRKPMLHRHPENCINGFAIAQGAITAPLYQQIVDWLRDNHSLSISILPYKNNEDKIELCWYYTITIIGIYNIFCNADLLNASKENYTSYNEALNKGIEEAFKLIK